MPPREIDTIINFICQIILTLLEGLHLLIILCTHAHEALIHVHNRLLQLVISTTRTTYQLIAVHEIRFQVDTSGPIEFRFGQLYNEEDFFCNWNTAPTPPPPAAPSVGTPDFATTPPREQEFLARLAAHRQRSPSLDPLDTLVMPIDYRRFAPTQFNKHLVFWVVCLLEALCTILAILREVCLYLTEDEQARIEGPVEDIQNITEIVREALDAGVWRTQIVEYVLAQRYTQYGDEDPLFVPDKDFDSNIIPDALIPYHQPSRFEEEKHAPIVIDLTEDDD
ncbi:hypothetical protein JAAARDRAFT_197840 [Jaapia argillacea MUCL 33604]|uniref:Uncharacterized protein n=1 Tax=Jaapia argillacea MUCL 33604 TaxID=933084 RepID=A0A067PE77_9AGAM|nr:hypothetical protein JAAARDRAFT_197840 [Jaapia argillacea MUCL 33604]